MSNTLRNPNPEEVKRFYMMFSDDQKTEDVEDIIDSFEEPDDTIIDDIISEDDGVISDEDEIDEIIDKN